MFSQFAALPCPALPRLACGRTDLSLPTLLRLHPKSRRHKTAPFCSRISVTSVPQLIITGDWGTKPPLLQQISRYLLRCPRVQSHRHQSHQHRCLASTLITIVLCNFCSLTHPCSSYFDLQKYTV